ncbi:type II secretion system protein [Candidatus Gracilibacteria bacterium]|nr:type II secretion system protein [Candidatus Gracilibacteria bacterium]
MKKTFPAFTLVELIVVITIIGILSTVGFVSYSNYLTGARDSNRYSQLTKLSDSLQVYATSKSLPLPDDYIEITASGASNVIAYQGYVGTDVLETIDYTNGGKDPKDDSFYTYYLTKDRKSLQLMALMEEAGSVAQNTISNTTFAADYSSRFPKVYGRKLGVLTEVDTNTPVQELSSILSGSGYLDILLTNLNYNSYISNEETIIGSGSSLYLTNPKGSCKRIKQTGQSQGNGVYIIDRFGEEIEVYCDMEKGTYLNKKNIIYLESSIFNGSFENSLDGFGVYSNSQQYNSYNTDSVIEANSLYVKGGATKTNVGNNGGVIITRKNPLTVGKQYTIEFYAKSLSGNQSISKSFQNGSGDNNCLSGGGLLTSEWSKFSKTCILDIDKNLIIFWTTKDSGEFLLDGVQMYEGPPLEN